MKNNGVFIIAEAGVNHNGSLDMAYQLIDAAVSSGADAVKFQTFTAERLASKSVSKAKYQKKATSDIESQYEMLKKLELSYEDYYMLLDYANKKKIKFLSTAFDIQGLKFLVNECGVDLLKIPSGEITNGPLLLEFARYKKPIILSTGMSSLSDIEQALSVLAFGLLGEKIPSTLAFREAYISTEGQRLLRKYVSLLHCTSEYPTSIENVNLKAMDTMKIAFGLNIGYSDHTLGITIPIAAVARGAAIIEKHFTIDKNLPGPDHRASLEPHELSMMVKSIREVESCLGSGVKRPSKIEVENQSIIRKNLVAARKLNQGKRLETDDIDVLRSEDGISPMNYWDVVGKVIKKSINSGDPIEI